MDHVNDERVGVMHLVDTLGLAGAERAAVGYVNHLPRELYRPFLCTTRADGPLEPFVADDVCRLRLQRQCRYALTPLMKLRRFIREQRIGLLHAHGSTLFVARMAQLGVQRPALIWHLHYGRWAEEDRIDWRYWMASLGVDYAVTSSDRLAEWLARRFPVPEVRVSSLPNMVELGPPRPADEPLPSKRGAWIACVANLRPEKDHVNLIRAFAGVVAEFPDAHLLLIGAPLDQAVLGQTRHEIERWHLASHVTMLGCRSDTYAILRQVDLGVLSSKSEGLPLALLEYGAAGLPVVATRVGQCPQVLDEGRAGILVPPGQPALLSEALRSLLASKEVRSDLGRRLKRRVEGRYGPEVVTSQLCDLYARTLARKAHSC
jgi:glycosyltransferase involved in cell wall biosynthesis